MRNGLTLLETVVCVAIVAVVAAIVAPVFGRARHAARVAAAGEQLRQMHRVVTIYRQDYEELPYGKPYPMGLPAPGDLTGQRPLWWLPKEFFFSPCGTHPEFRAARTSFWFVWFSEEWPPYVESKQESSMLIVDPNCTDHEKELGNDYLMHFGIGVRLDGSVARKRALGPPDDLPFWGYPQKYEQDSAR